MHAADQWVRYIDVLKVKHGARKARHSKAFRADTNIPHRRDDSFSPDYLSRHFEEISQRLRQDRIRKGWTTKDIANLAGVSERTVWKYENGLLPEDRMDIAILKKLGKLLVNNSQSYLTEYHLWLMTTAQEDVRWLLAHHPYRNVDDLSRACHATHRSLYLWRKGIGRPNLETWTVIKNLREMIAPS